MVTMEEVPDDRKKEGTDDGRWEVQTPVKIEVEKRETVGFIN